HEAVGVLMVLVGADAVEAGARGVQQLVERPVVVLPDASRVRELRPRRRHPHARVALLEVRRQLAMRHQVERADLHVKASVVTAYDGTAAMFAPGQWFVTSAAAREPTTESGTR